MEKHDSPVMADWKCFCEAWFVFKYEPVTLVSQGQFIASDSFSKRFPKLTELLSASRLYLVDTCKGRRHLHVWTAPDGTTFGWLCYSPRIDTTVSLPFHVDHRLLLLSFGGIDEYWNGPESLLSNLNGALGVNDATKGIGGEELFVHACRIYGIQPNLNPSDYLVFATEANGDTFIYHQKSGDVLLLAHDTGRTNLQPVDGSANMLYTVNGARDFCGWVEMLAEEHLARFRGG